MESRSEILSIVGKTAVEDAAEESTSRTNRKLVSVADLLEVYNLLVSFYTKRSAYALGLRFMNDLLYVSVELGRV